MLCRVLGVSTSGYCGWRHRPESERAAASRALLTDSRAEHAESGGAHGGVRIVDRAALERATEMS